MKRMTTALALCAALGMSAQDTLKVDLHLAGQHLENAGNLRNRALLIAALTCAGGGFIAAVEADNVPLGAGIALAGLCLSIDINSKANRNERDAGRIMQGLPPKPRK